VKYSGYRAGLCTIVYTVTTASYETDMGHSALVDGLPHSLSTDALHALTAGAFYGFTLEATPRRR